MGKKLLRRGAGLVGAVLLAFAVGAAARADSVQGKGRVIAKDLVARTVTVSDHDKPLRVGRGTVLLDPSGKHITLDELEVMPQPRPGAYVRDPKAVVEWVADQAAGGLVARRIQELGVERD